MKNRSAGCANLVERIINKADLSNPNRVKAILSAKNNLIFLSRQPVPSTVFDVDRKTKYLRLTCITAYRGPFLQYYCKLSRTPIEMIEGNDLMRVIEHDIKVPSGISPYETQPVDTPEDIKMAERILTKDRWFRDYKNRHRKNG